MRGEAWGVTCDEPFCLELRMEIMGNVKPYEDGRCSLAQMGMGRLKRRVLDHLYYVNDQKLMYPHMHVLSWLMFASQKTGGTPALRQAEWLELLLDTGLYPVTLAYARFLTAAEQAAVAIRSPPKSRACSRCCWTIPHEVPQSMYAAFPGAARLPIRASPWWSPRPAGPDPGVLRQRGVSAGRAPRAAGNRRACAPSMTRAAW
jgi:hypothetical protein